MSSSKKIDLLTDFAAGVYLSEAQNLIPPPPLHTVYEGQQGRVHINKAGMKIPTWLKVRKKHLPQSLFNRLVFLDDDILHWLLWVLSFYATRQHVNFVCCYLENFVNRRKNGKAFQRKIFQIMPGNLKRKFYLRTIPICNIYFLFYHYLCPQ